MVGGKACVADEILGLFNGGEPVVLEHVFFYDDAVDVVGAGIEPEFSEREAHPEQRDFDMRDVVEEYAAEREQLEVFIAAYMPDGELVRLWLECPYHEALESLRNVLRFAHVVQVLDDFFGCLDAPEYDVRAPG